MNKVLKIFILIIVLAAIGAGLWVWLSNKSTPPATNQPLVNEPAVNNNQPATPAVISPLPSDQQQIISLAKLFTARYGSYSTDARFQNLKELSYLYTPAMQSYIDQYLASAQGSAGYYSVATRPLAVAILSQSEASAVVAVNNQRQEVFSLGGESQLIYQKLRLQFKKIDGEWRVDAANWE